MDLRARLQRVLHIVEEVECAGALSDLERDIVLNDLREAYAELKFGKAENENFSNEGAIAAAVEPTVEEKSEPEAEEVDEPEVEVELIFDDEQEDDEQLSEPEPEPIPAPAPAPTPAPTPAPAETPIIPTTLTTPTAPVAPITPATPKRSPLLSLYEDNPTPVLGEQFRETPSVADAITCPKGVAESAPVLSLRDAIGVADKFMLLGELFDDDLTAYENAIDNLDRQESLEDCVIYISENYAWRAQSEGAKLMMKLLQRRFNE